MSCKFVASCGVLVIAAAWGRADTQEPPASAGKTFRLHETARLSCGMATLTKLDQLPVVDSELSRRFHFDSQANPKLAELRERYRLADVVAAGKTEFQRQVLLMDWVHQQFKKFGRPSKNVRGALDVLQAIEEGHSFFCSQYTEVFVSSAASLGWVARPLALRRHQGVAAVGGSTEHSVTEVWSNQHRKWVMLDPTSNLYLERDGVPLNAYEIRHEWFYRDGTDLVFVVGKTHEKFRKRDLPIVLKHFDGFGDLAFHPDELDKYGFIGYIPNTDLMDSGYDYAQMFITKDSLCDGTQWHQRDAPSHPAVDPYFPIGQTAVRLHVVDGKLYVELSTMTPNFANFEMRQGDGTWMPIGASFKWQTHPGTNGLEVRTVNSFSVRGPASTATVEVE